MHCSAEARSDTVFCDLFLSFYRIFVWLLLLTGELFCAIIWFEDLHFISCGFLHSEKVRRVLSMKNETFKTVAQNKKAFHNYFVEEKFEAGIELFGTEVKSVRQGKVSIKEAWCSITDGQLLLSGMHISPYEKGNIFNKDPLRVKRLLMHKREIMRLLGLVKQVGYTLVPLSVYFKGSLVKVCVGLCKGKKIYDKRSVIAQKDAQRKIERTIKEYNR